jgi:hypothetical protein
LITGAGDRAVAHVPRDGRCIDYHDTNWLATEGIHVMQYVVLQVILKEKLWGTGSGNLTSLEKAINDQAAKGYRLHTITTASSGSKGLGGGDRIQATLVFESLG